MASDLVCYDCREAMKNAGAEQICGDNFAGIIIKLLFNDTVQHNKPHVHVYYGEYQASVGIDGELLAGSLPVKQLKMVVILQTELLTRGRECRRSRCGR